MRIAVFASCLVETLFPRAAIATVRILERLGHQVIVPEQQACCGQMHINSGQFRQALPVIRNHIRSFDTDDYDVAVAPTGSCIASIKHQHSMVIKRCGADDLLEPAQRVADRSYELSELLIDVLGVTDVGAYFPHRVTYHPSCHGMRVLRLGDRQQQLLEKVQGLELVPLPDAEQCCGFGGTFAVKNAEVSSAMLADKVSNISATEAPWCVGGDYSCLLHISGGLSRQNTGVRTIHLAEILASTQEEPYPEAISQHSGSTDDLGGVHG